MLYTGMLCGSFSTHDINLQPTAIDPSWEHIIKTREDRLNGHRFYYPKFYDLCFNDNDSRTRGFDRYRINIDRDITLNLKEDYLIHIKHIELCLCPMGIALFDICITAHLNNSSDIAYVMSFLRNIINYTHNTQALELFIDTALRPILKILHVINPSVKTEDLYDLLVLHGNKFKIFQMVEIDSSEKSNLNLDILLFEIGTLCPIRNQKLSDPNSPSQRYYDNILRNNLISIFNNWQALALLDTFTTVSETFDDSTRENWVDNYFGMIYLYNMFVKVYLLEINSNYHYTTLGDNSPKHTLNESYNIFDALYYTPDISYNFLPQLMHKHINAAVEIEAEKKRIFERIERQKLLHDRQADSKLNKLLLAMTCMTMFSAIWDACCLINEMIPYKNIWASSISGFRFVSSVLLCVILLCFIIIFKKGRRIK